MSKNAEKRGKIPHISHKIPGFCNFRDFYREVIEWVPDGGKFVEVGVYYGSSLSYAIVEAINAGKKIDFVAVDSFTFSTPEGWAMVDKFYHCMSPLEGYFRVLQSNSAEAAWHFAAKSVDFVFIDADHTYDAVKMDLTAWIPKIKPGGIIAGHDYNYPHDGCVKAVNEMFGEAVVPIPSDDFDAEHRPFYSWKVQL
jgi:cephalosporin hydroxylase